MGKAMKRPPGLPWASYAREVAGAVGISSRVGEGPEP
jgi:hypothetical protein